MKASLVINWNLYSKKLKFIYSIACEPNNYMTVWCGLNLIEIWTSQNNA